MMSLAIVYLFTAVVICMGFITAGIVQSIRYHSWAPLILDTLRGIVAGFVGSIVMVLISFISQVLHG